MEDVRAPMGPHILRHSVAPLQSCLDLRLVNHDVCSEGHDLEDIVVHSSCAKGRPERASGRNSLKGVPPKSPLRTAVSSGVAQTVTRNHFALVGIRYDTKVLG